MSTQPHHTNLCMVKLNGKIVGYLNADDIENGMDIKLDLQGFEIIAID